MSTPSSIHRDKLYKEIWQEPATKVAARYGISGSMLARICKELNVPRPGLGHWAKVAHKHKISIPMLPALQKGQKESWEINHANVATQRSVQQIKVETHAVPVDDKVHHILTAELNEHKAVRDTRRALKGQKPNDKGIVRPRWTWRHLNISVSPDQLERSLFFMNRFLQLCEYHGINVHCPIDKNPKQDWDPYSRGKQESGVISLRQGDHELSFALREGYNRKEKPDSEHKWYDKYDYHPSGKLEFKIDGWIIHGQRFWKDGKIKRVEDSILIAAQQAKNYFVDQIEEEKERQREKERCIREKEHRAFVDKFRKQLRNQRKFEELTFKKVIAQASDWNQADQLRRFIHACEESMESMKLQGLPITDEDLLKLRWMKIRVEMLDPLSSNALPCDFIPQSVAEGREPGSTPRQQGP